MDYKHYATGSWRLEKDTMEKRIEEILYDFALHDVYEKEGDILVMDKDVKKATLAILQVVREYVPKKKEDNSTFNSMGVWANHGWNACIDEINKALGI